MEYARNVIVIRRPHIDPADGLFPEKLAMGSKRVVPFFRVFNFSGYEDRGHLK
jgi:hypothetical protein|tara:strand:+ start:9995 stop:10153 length:159 start_codon:yes stop_codon:yes gene_type:complete